MAGTPGVKNDIGSLRSRVADLVPDFRSRAGEAERLRTMPADLVQRARAAGLFRLNLPRSLGGYELDPVATVEIFEEISRADGSAGWTIVIGNSTAFFAWLDPAVASELIAGQPDFVCTSMWAPLGQAAGQPGGFTVSGRWPFNSGCPHAAWLQVGVLVTDSGMPPRLVRGAPDWRFAFVPARSAVIEDTWHAMGLCGTGSHHLTLSGVQVPPERIAAPFFEPARHDGPLFRIPLVTLATMFLAAVLLAANQTVRAAIDAVDRVFPLAGADAVLASNSLQRCFRDIHAAGQHILFSNGRDQAYAKVRLGIDQPTYLI